MFCNKGVIRNFARVTGKHLCQRLFFNKVEKESLAQVFSCEFREIAKNTSFYRTPPVAASGNVWEGVVTTLEFIQTVIIFVLTLLFHFLKKCIPLVTWLKPLVPNIRSLYPKYHFILSFIVFV